MLIAGLTGGMACGKSFVARALAELGAQIIEADDLGHEVLRPGGDAYQPVVAAFGPVVLDPAGNIDRSVLASRVFGNPAELERLNAIVHPAVRNLAQRRTAEVGERDPHAVVVYVAAILLESGAYHDVQKIIVVSCAREQQIERAMDRPGATEQDVLARLERQMPLDEKKKRADYIIDTSGTRDDTLRQTTLVWEDLIRQA
jgi:dephospho-CoA kinase